MLKKLRVITVVFLYLLSPKIYSKENNIENSFDQIKELGVLKVCSQAGFIPFEMKDNKGNWKGFDIDIMTEFTKQNDLKLQMLDTAMDALIPSLITKKCDFIASGLTITEDRKKAVLFSNPIYNVVITAALINTEENKEKYKKFSDIDVVGTKIASHTGSASTLFLKTFIKKATHLQFDSESDEVNALLQKRVNVFVDDDILIKQVANEMKINFYTLSSDGKGELAMASRKKDYQLMQKFNEFLDKIKKNGQYDSIKRNYFF